jgi:hypothetical protein
VHELRLSLGDEYPYVEDNRLGLPLVCLPLWLGGCDPYILSCMINLYAINASHRVRPVGQIEC